jgi:effector-binding domain-containing protein
MPYDVHVKHVDPQPTAVVRYRAKPGELSRVIPEGCGKVWEFIKKSAIPHTGRNLAVYFDGEINLECGVIVLRPFESAGPVISSTTPGGNVATVAHFGPYGRLGDANKAIHDWCVAEARTLAGPCWEIYDHWTDDESKLRTDVFYLLDEKAPA